MNDPEIAAALLASSPAALAELFDAYGDRLFRYCWSRLRNRETAHIALRDTLVVAQAHIGRLADHELLGPWLYSLARAECRRRRPAPAAEADEAPARPSQGDADSRLMAWNAVMSMDAAEFEILDLACRHDVDLGLVLGVPAAAAAAGRGQAEPGAGARCRLRARPRTAGLRGPRAPAGPPRRWARCGSPRPASAPARPARSAGRRCRAARTVHGTRAAGGPTRGPRRPRNP